MCGISSVIMPRNPSEAYDLTSNIINSFHYRGPDATGFYHDDNITIGSCRLSIVDLIAGNQPLYNENGNLVLVCNGEIYNHNELRHYLLKKGHVFSTNSDSEVILHLYEENGIDFLKDLSGMFAFILWDKINNNLLVARDRMGIKPLYYYKDNFKIVFSSEMKGLITNLNLRPHINPTKLWEYLCFGFPVDNEQTIDDQVKRVKPGEAILISDMEMKHIIYWQPKYLDRSCENKSFDISTFKDKFIHSLKSHFICEVPSAVMLSGGLDSTSIVEYSIDLGFSPHLITVGYKGDFACDETQYAIETAHKNELDITKIELSYDDYSSSFNELVQYCDEPVADIAAIPQWSLFKIAKELGFKVLHNGLGGDEVFYGYDIWNDLCQLFLNNTYTPYFSQDDITGMFYHPGWRAARIFLEKCAPEDYKAQCRNIDKNLSERLENVKLSAVDQVYNALLRTWLPNNCLHLGDRLSMAHSIELRVPFLDNGLVDYVHSLPAHERFNGMNSKHIFKQFIQEKFDNDFIQRPKRGFTPPAEFMSDLIISSKDMIIDGFLSKYFLKKNSIQKAWNNTNYPNIWFHIIILESWINSAYS